MAVKVKTKVANDNIEDEDDDDTQTTDSSVPNPSLIPSGEGDTDAIAIESNEQEQYRGSQVPETAQQIREAERMATLPEKKNKTPLQANASRNPLMYGQPAYDVFSDYDVPHSGTTDEDGIPRYDEAPIRGGHIAKQTIASNGRRVTADVNAKGQQIYPDTGDTRTPATLVNPERDAVDNNQLES